MNTEDIGPEAMADVIAREVYDIPLTVLISGNTVGVQYQLERARAAADAVHQRLRKHLEATHKPTDGRLDYCECGESWPCSARRMIEKVG